MDEPHVGTGVWVRKAGEILFGLRKSDHGKGTWCPPGGRVEFKEDPLQCAIRETREESGIEIENVRLMTYTSDFYPDKGAHWVTFCFAADWKSGEASLLEPDKFERWEWRPQDAIPEPLLISSRNLLNTGYNPFTF